MTTIDIPVPKPLDNEEHKFDSLSQDAEPHRGSLSDKEKPNSQNGDTGSDVENNAVNILGNDAPDGGLQAWLQVLGSWALMFNTFGTLVAFGDYQAFYETGHLFSQSSSNISWIGSIQSLMVFTVGAVIGPIYDRGHLRVLLFVGSFGIVFGHMMLSLSHEYWQVLLAQGFCVGIGGGCLFVPALAILQAYFSTRLGLAVGVAATGSSVGGVLYPVMFTNLINCVGFGWTVRAIGFVALATLLIPIAVSRQRTRPASVRKLLDVSAFTDGPFMLCIFACFLGYTGSYVALFYTSFYGRSQGLTSASLSLYLTPILNAASAVGRVAPNYLSDIIGPVNVITPGSLLIAIVLLGNLAVHTSAGIICTALAFGFLSGLFVATPPLLFVALTPDRAKLGARMGMAYAMVGLAVLPGGPGAGGVLQQGGGGSGGGGDSGDGGRDWRAAWTYAGVLPVGACVAFCVLRVWKSGWRVWVKV